MRAGVQQLLEKFQFRYADGHRYVGGYIGSRATRDQWLAPQIEQWVRAVKSLAKVARRYPQTAYAGLALSLQHEWQYLQRVTSGIKDQFVPIEQALVEDFLPALFQASPTSIQAMRGLLELPVRQGGLGIRNPTSVAEANHTASVSAVQHLVDCLVYGTTLDLTEYRSAANASRVASRALRLEAEETQFQRLLDCSDKYAKHRIQRACQAGGWLSISPNRLNGTELSAEEFRDSLRLRYGLEPEHLPANCSGCSAQNSVQHALECKVGGLVVQRHNEVAGEWHSLCAQAFTKSAVSDEPLIPSSQNRSAQRDGPNGSTTTVQAETRGDVAVRGFWKRGTTAIFDIQVSDTDAKSYREREPLKVLDSQEKRKKDKHLHRCLNANRQFTPLVFSVDGMRGTETSAACQRLAALLATKWGRPYSVLCGYVRSRLSVALVRTLSLCLRGSREPRKHFPAQLECGAGLRAFMQ